ncbi:MAG: hypothetical protein WA751_00985 [Candidatus Dormiibacterota bacterium]
METRGRRAWRDARPWRLSRKDAIVSIVSGAVAFFGQWIFGGGASVTALLISIGVVVVVALLVPAGVFSYSWLTAVGRIHGDELQKIRGEIDGLKTALIRKQEASALLVQLQQLQAIGKLINQRIPSFGQVPEDTAKGLTKEIDDWAAKVSGALGELPDLKAQFDAAPDDNQVLAALNASSLTIRLQNRANLLAEIIKFVAARDGVKS